VLQPPLLRSRSQVAPDPRRPHDPA